VSVELHEYETRDAVVLTTAQIDALRTANVAVVPSMTTPGTFELTASSTVGVLRVDGRQFSIRPKVGIRRLLFLLSFASTQDWLQPWVSTVDDDHDLLDAMARIYAHVADTAISQGVRRGYRHRAEAAVTIRGRIAIGRQLNRHHDRTLPIELDYDDYTLDTDANRLLLAAALRLRGAAARTPPVGRLLARTVSRLEGVTPIGYRGNLPRITLTRLDRHYAIPVLLARLILSSRSVELRDGTSSTDAMLFDMNRIFEDFVVAGLRAELGLEARSFPQNGRGHHLSLDQADDIRLEPDLSWWRDGRCVFVGDVKYKIVSRQGIAHSDLYQLLAYATATDLPTAMLIYASGTSDGIVHRVRHANKDLEIRSLDLTVELDALRGQLRCIADDIRCNVEQPALGVSRVPSAGWVAHAG
jgi:5-methylcytosine-specific restriction enzyme subunit McrC